MKKELVSIKDISPIVAECYTEFETIEERDSYIEKVKKILQRKQYTLLFR